MMDNLGWTEIRRGAKYRNSRKRRTREVAGDNLEKIASAFSINNNFGDILETDLEIVCVSCLGKSDITAGRPLVNYLLIIERGAVGDSPPRGALAEPKSW